MESTPPPVSGVESFEALIDRRDFAALEGAWMDRVAGAGESGPEDPAPFLAAADLLLASGERERAATLLDLLLRSLAAGPAARRLPVLRRLVAASPRRTDLRAELTACLREMHAGDTVAEVCLAVSGLETASDLTRSLALLDKLLRFRPGACVNHASGWGVGVVESVDAVLRQVSVDLEKKRHHRMDLKAAADILEPLPADHFLALGRDGGTKLRELAESDPAALIGIVVASFGSPLELKAIKGQLVPGVISADGWSRWWNRTKGLLRDSGFFRVADRAPYTVERLERSVSYEDELLRQFERGTPAERIGIAKKHGRDRSEFPRLRERALAELRAHLARDPRALDAAVALERIGGAGAGAESPVVRALRAAADPVAVVLAMEGTEERRRVVEALKEALGDSWPEAALGLLSRGDEGLRDEAARLLEGSAAEGRAAALVAEGMRAPRTYPELFAWACRCFLDGAESPILAPVRAYPPRELLGRMLDTLDNLGMRAERDGKALVRDTITRVRALLSGESSRWFRETIRPLPREEARGVYARVLSSGGLSEPLRVKLLEILMVEFPDITRPEVRPIWEEDAIYVTESGLQKKQVEFKDLTEEKLPRNFKDIGRAAAFGDLSENAEYTAALEERDRLTKRATEIKAQLDQVRLIKPEMLKAGEVTVGSRVRLVNPETGHEIGYRILGPWDGGPEDGVLNYRSPLAITLLGKHVGDEVEAQLPGGTERFKIVEVGSSFEPPDTARR